VLFVHAHPDDETISTGGTIATLVQAGAHVTVLTCTRGERGEVIPPDLAALRDDPEALAAHRELELASAMRELGVVDHRFLGSDDARMNDLPTRRYRDSGMRWGASGAEPTGDAGPEALTTAPLGEVAADIATVIATTRATTVVSYDPTGGYGHPDHVAAQAAARHAAEVMVVPFWSIEPPGAPPSSRRSDRRVLDVDVGPVIERKRAALRAHRSQLTVTDDSMRMPGGQVEPITVVERFRLDDDRPVRMDWETGGAGLRAAVCVLAFVVGAAIGALATVSHPAVVEAFGVTVPVGVVGGLVVVAVLLSGLRLAFRTRIVTALAAAGVLGAIALLALESVGGSVLIPADSDLSYLWLYGPAAITLVVLAWPDLRRGARIRIDRENDPRGPAAP
jgi:N-acetyl-1-D-myo-inositol-2-amino-2-deoxy-alpha-D-glucopyranoside deacetylase